MKPEVGRRMFVGTVATGLPLMAGTGVGLLAQARGPGTAETPHDHVTGTEERDPILEHIAREIAVVHNRAQARGHVTGEDARILAAHFRTLGAYSRRSGLDDKVKERGRQIVREKGRDALLYPVQDEAKMRSELKQHGMNMDRRFFDLFRMPDHAQRERAVDRVLRDGASPVFSELGAALERAAGRLDQDYVRLVRAGGGGQDAAYWEGYCNELSYQVAQAAALAAAACGPTFAGVILAAIFGPTCAATSGGLAVLSAVYFYRC